MKSNFFKAIFGSLFLLIGITSCKNQCQRCTDGIDSYTVCEDDFPNKQAYKAYISLMESYGYNCKRD